MDLNPDLTQAEQVAKHKAMQQQEKGNQSFNVSVVEILQSLNASGNTQVITQAFKDKMNEGTLGNELIAAIFYKVKDIVVKEAPNNSKITQEQAANYFHQIRGLFSVISPT